MLHQFPFYLAFIVVILLLIMLANKWKIAYPVLLVLAGLLISFIPSVPVLHIDPELIFIIFLPPLLYEAAWSISWKEFWKWRRIITSFAFVVVFITAIGVAIIANHFIPGFSLALGFLLGGIVSPPDAVSAGAILKFVKVPKRMASILEGESLLNDASSLIIFRFAMIAVATGQFVWYKAALNFGWMVIAGIGVGLAIGWVFKKAHQVLPTDANMDIALTLIAPYVMYIVAEEIHCSGVLAVVCGGLYLSRNRYRFLSSTARLQAMNVWQSLVFILNGLVFFLIGLDLPEISAGLEGVSLSAAIGYGLLIAGVLVVARIISSYGAVLVTLVARNFISVADNRHPGWKAPVLLGWTGMRGVVSLAAALSIPVQLADGTAFPQRNLILFITFVVILSTLVVQGLTLPYLIRKLSFPVFDDYLSEEETTAYLSQQINEKSRLYIAEKFNDLPEKELLFTKLLNKEYFQTENFKPAYLDLLNQQRNWLIEIDHASPEIDEELIREQLHLLDIEEERLKNS